MKYPPVEFISDIRSQASYLCFIAKDIINGRFQRAGFQILPYPAKNHFYSVYFPDLNLSSDFWKNIQSCTACDLGADFPSSCIQEVENKIKNTKIPQFNSSMLDVNKFFSVSIRFLNFDFNFKISVLLTPYGTCGSFHPVLEDSKYNLLITHRTDMHPNTIFRTLLLGIYRMQTHKICEIDDTVGRHGVAVVDYLLTHSFFAKQFPQQLIFTPTSQMITDSQNYLAALGVSGISHKLTIDLVKLLTPQEKLLFDYLLENNNELVDFNKSAEIVWKDMVDQKYSLYALSKIVESIRRKIRSLGINREVLHTSRRRGYILSA